MAGFFGELARQALDAPRLLRPATLAPRRGPDAEPVDESLELNSPTTGTSDAGPHIAIELDPVQSLAISAAAETAPAARGRVTGQSTGDPPLPTSLTPPREAGQNADPDGRRLPRHRVAATMPTIEARPSETAPEKATTVETAHAASDAPKAAPESATPLRPATLPTARAAPAASDRRSRSPLVVADTVPDVHIHIGRIELTAPGAGLKPAKRKPDAGKKPMSLDEYLQHRRGKSP